MEHVLSNLTELVEREVQAFRDLLSLLAQQRDCIVNRRIDDLRSTVEQEESLIEVTRDLERRRREQVEILSNRLGSPVQSMTLAQVIQAVEGTYAVRLSELRDSLLAMMRKLQTSNERNRFLIEHTLGYVDHHIHLLTGQGAQGTPYTRQGTRISEPGCMLVNQVA